MVGSIGVATLLLAFVLNLNGCLAARSRAYHTLNATGAALAATASAMIGFVPFIVLEGAWCIAAFGALTGLPGRFLGGQPEPDAGTRRPRRRDHSTT